MTARALLAAVFTMLALPAAAQDCGQPILIVREDGIPVYNTPTKESYEEFHDYVRPHMGDAPSDRPILVIDIRTHHGAWVSRELLGKVVNMYDATVQDALLYKGPNHCRPKGIPWIPFDPAEPGREPIELFPDLAADTGPRSGLWRAEIGPTEVTGCPAMMRDAFPASAGALSGMTGDTRRMTFADPFHPDTLEMSRATGVWCEPVGKHRSCSRDICPNPCRYRRRFHDRIDPYGHLPRGDAVSKVDRDCLASRSRHRDGRLSRWLSSKWDRPLGPCRRLMNPSIGTR